MLVSCGVPLTDPALDALSPSIASDYRALGPATCPSRNRGSCLDPTFLIDFCNQREARAHPRTLTPHTGPRFHASRCVGSKPEAVSDMTPELPPVGTRSAGHAGRKLPRLPAFCDAEADSCHFRAPCVTEESAVPGLKIGNPAARFSAKAPTSTVRANGTGSCGNRGA